MVSEKHKATAKKILTRMGHSLSQFDMSAEISRARYQPKKPISVTRKKVGSVKLTKKNVVSAAKTVAQNLAEMDNRDLFLSTPPRRRRS